MKKFLVALAVATPLLVVVLLLAFACLPAGSPDSRSVRVLDASASEGRLEYGDSPDNAALRMEMGLDRPKFPGLDIFQGEPVPMPAATAAPPPLPQAMPTPAPASSVHGYPGSPGPMGGQLPAGQRQVISTASLSLRVEDVPAAIDLVREIAQGTGGFVQQMSSFGEGDERQATIILRVPQGLFSAALQGIEALGKPLDQDLGREDVSEQLIDLKARLGSSQREEKSLLALLDRANQVSEILAVERELNRVRSDIERLEGRLNFLERQVALATITVSLVPRGVSVAPPPSASLRVETSRVAQRVDEVLAQVESLKGEIDLVHVSAHDGRERAEVSFRVFPGDFARATEFLEGLGEVRSKDFLVEAAPEDAEREQPEEPNAPVSVVLGEKDSSNVLWITIAAVIGGLVLAAAIGVGGLYTYRAGRRSRDRYAV